MSDPITQDDRFLAVTTPLGKDGQGGDILLASRFTATESVSRLFTVDLTLQAELTNADSVIPSQLIGKAMSIRVSLRRGGPRFFHGLVSRFVEDEEDERFRYYRAQLVPWLWLHTLTSDCRIFQNLNVPDIIKKVFDARRLGEFQFRLDPSKYTKRDYCVQYRETDFNFVSRLMEEEGIFYFFKHEAGRHILVMADAIADSDPCPNQRQARYGPRAGMGEREDLVTAWQMTQSLRPGMYTLRDYHFEMSSKTLEAIEFGAFTAGVNNTLELYDYPGDYAEKFCETGQRLDQVEPEGRKFARLRMEEEETPHQIATGASWCRPFCPGFRFQLTGHVPAMNGDYVLMNVDHSAVQTPDYVSTASDESPYHNTFTAIPLKAFFRPPRLTPKPVVLGLQTAVVVGKTGEEIWTDKYGRIKVQFHWDRDGKKDDASSCWVRVAQVWAGKQWGAMFIPRVGHEVVVDFLEGDPDRPIIVGSVYNDANMPPYDLPSNQTRSTIKTRSSKNGNAANFNEIRFEDTKGEEELYIHAERNLTTMVEADESRTVGHDRSTSIGRDDTTTIERDDTLTVGRNRSATVALNDDETIGAQQNITVGATITITAGGMVTITAPTIVFNTAILQVSGVVQCSVVQTQSVVSPLYTPGVGNLI
jgi:type VI secretion system secreted protein VgrG